MSDQNDATFLFLLVECEYNDNTGFYLPCLSQNDGIDESRYNIEERLKSEGISKCVLAEVGVVNSSEIDMDKYEPDPTNDIRLGLTKYIFESRDDYLFINPSGVVISAHSPIDRDTLTLSYSLIDDNYASYAIEIIPDANTIEQTISRICAEIINDLNFIGMYLDGHYDNNDADYNSIWVKTGDTSELLAFLFKHKRNILENGFIAIELGNQHTNNRIRITKTKELLYWSDTNEQYEQLKDILTELGYSFNEKNVSMANDCEHFKYRMKDSLGIDALISLLIENQFNEHTLS